MEPIDLDSRKQRILQAIVQDYVATAEPVGSHVLVTRYSLGVKSATIRSEMAEMSERGYLRQPHTSAGRVPSDKGYRFYVDRMLHLPVIQEDEARQARAVVRSAATEMDAVLRRTCQVLASMTRLPAMATSPDADDTELRQIFVSPAGADKALLVLLFSNGRTENRLLRERITATDALVLANALNERFGGETLSRLRASDEADQSAPPSMPTELRPFAAIWKRLSDEITGVARAIASETPMFVEGAHNALEQPEFRDVERLAQILFTLQERAALIEMLGSALEERVVIGEENRRPALAECSIISSPYFVGTRERGTIGVLGPTRMDYGRVAAVVRFMAQTVGELLTQLSVAR